MQKINKKFFGSIILLLGIVFLSGCSNEDEVYNPENQTTENQETETTVQDDQDSNNKLTLNTNGCIGCGKCVKVDPSHFEMENRKAIITSQENLDSNALQNAIKKCPVDVINLS